MTEINYCVWPEPNWTNCSWNGLASVAHRNAQYKTPDDEQHEFEQCTLIDLNNEQCIHAHSSCDADNFLLVHLSI